MPGTPTSCASASTAVRGSEPGGRPSRRISGSDCEGGTCLRQQGLRLSRSARVRDAGLVRSAVVATAGATAAGTAKAAMASSATFVSHMDRALGKRVSKSRMATQSGRTVMRAIAFPRKPSTHAFPASSPRYRSAAIA
jgi:hypothetical protein